MPKDFSGDFITDHPIASLFLGGCLLGLINSQSEKTAKDRYAIDQAERRKEAYRRQLMAEHPIKWPSFVDEFFMFSWGVTKSEAENLNGETLINKWNSIHAGLFRFDCDLIFSTENEEENANKIYEVWINSKEYKSLYANT